MILVDTSVWIDHLRNTDTTLQRLLKASSVVCHPFVIGELACGNLQQREQVLNLLRQLPAIPQTSHAETMWFIDHHGFAGHGIGWVDTHLLASCALTGGTQLWTRDKRLAAVAGDLGLAWPDRD